MKKSYLSLYNHDVVKEIHDLRFNTAKSDRFIEAALLSSVIVESSLRALILSRVLTLKMDYKRFKKYWDNPETPFNTLIVSAELLGVEAKIVDLLNTFRKERNELMHNSIHINVKGLEKLSKSMIRNSVKLTGLIDKNLGLGLCACGSGKSLNDCDCDEE